MVEPRAGPSHTAPGRHPRPPAPLRLPGLPRMTATLLDDATQARVVAAYLKRHPEFLSEYPELAAKLTMPSREQGGAVASLAVYQMQSLRDKNAELERRLAELIEIAAENERLMERVHGLTVALLRASTIEVTVRTVAARLSADFHTEQVRRLLFGEDPGTIQSLAMMQLGHPGTLAIGNTQPDRVQPGMGTLFPKLISATI